MGRAIRALVKHLVENNREPHGVSNAVFQQLIDTPDHEIKDIVERIGVIELSEGYKLVSCPGDPGSVCFVNKSSCEGVVLEETYSSGGIFDKGRTVMQEGSFEPVKTCPYHGN